MSRQEPGSDLGAILGLRRDGVRNWRERRVRNWRERRRRGGRRVRSRLACGRRPLGLGLGFSAGSWLTALEHAGASLLEVLGTVAGREARDALRDFVPHPEGAAVRGISLEMTACVHHVSRTAVVGDRRPKHRPVAISRWHAEGVRPAGLTTVPKVEAEQVNRGVSPPVR